MKNWFDRSGLLRAFSWEEGDQLNGILHLAYLIFLMRENKQRALASKLYALKYIEQVYQNKKLWQGIEVIGKDEASHDDATAIICLLNLCNRKILRDWNIFSYSFRPEFFLYAHTKGKSWAKFFLWIVKIKIVLSFLRDYKASNGIYETDGKLLGWLIYKSYSFRNTERVCEFIMQKKFGKSWLSKLFAIKFEEVDHPINVQARIYDKISLSVSDHVASDFMR